MARLDQSGRFLEGVSLRPVELAGRGPFQPVGLALGKGASALEVLVVSHRGEPALPALRSAWKARKAGRAAPLLLIALYNGKASLCGPTGEDAPAFVDLDTGQVERICREALDQPDRHAALRALAHSMPMLGSDMAGVRNEGFLATHELRAGARQRADWDEAGKKAARILSKRGKDLLTGLGFQVEGHDRVVSILRAGDRKVAVAVLLNQDESPEIQAERFSDLSPITYALTVADRENLPYVVLQHGAKVRVYPTRVGVGVGRRGRTETYVECHTGLLRDADAAFLWLLCSAEALREGGSLGELIEESGRFAGGLAERLRERVYQSVVPKLAEGIVKARRLRKADAEALADTYEMTMAVLFRLLFIAYAEDKDLLPFGSNGLYRSRSLKNKSLELLELTRKGAAFDEGTSHWEEVSRLFRAVDKGNREWEVPAYDGGLFTSDSEVSRVGALLAEITLPNTVMGPALRDLLLVETPEGLGPVDFRSLGVREFGTIYEGLLQSELSAAEVDLVVDAKGVYRPAREGETPLVRRGEIYLHDASGARKATGSYFTKHFAVEHLLDRSLEPALRTHLERLNGLGEDAAGERFFDFRIADIAMGSAHFLVAAVDHIERAFTDYLSRRRLPNVTEELATLRAAAREALGPLADQTEIEDTQLLRRLIARRCIYGVDLNGTSVQLAKLGLWIHTFVPGLPLSLLDHNLREGNALVGIGTLDELRDALESESLPLFPVDATHLLGDAREHLAKLARTADANLADLRRARSAMEAARKAIAPTAALCDLVTANRIEGRPIKLKIEEWEERKLDLFKSADLRKAKEVLKDLEPFHFPVAFPEVFLRQRPGFDVIVGNPPWQEATIEQDAFWARHAPGLRSLPQREQEQAKAKLRKERPDLVKLYEAELAEVEGVRRALTAGPFPGMGTGDPDLYKAFCWRFWHLVAKDGGRLGVVLPRSALAAKGSAEFRREIFEHADEIDVTMLVNNRQWFFEDVHPQYTIGLLALEKHQPDRTPVALRGPYPSLERYRGGVVKEPAVFYGSDIEQWNDTASLPLLPSEESAEVFAQLRKSPRLDLDDGRSWRARPHTELHATNDKEYMDLSSSECPDGFWPVYKGESFDLWNPDTGTYYAWADPETLVPVLQTKRSRGASNRRSPFSEFDDRQGWLRNPKTLPCHEARIAFRDVTRATDSRTLRVALVPPRIFLANQAPTLLWPRGTVQDQAFLLGALGSLVLDWYARRFVETHMNYFVFNPLPVPRVNPQLPIARRLVELAGRLASPDDRFAAWANEVGVEHGPLGAAEKDDKIHEIDAIVAHLYGLTEKQLVHVFETFHEGWDHEAQLRATLQHFRDWKSRL